MYLERLENAARKTVGVEPKDFYITGDPNVELKMMCTDEKDIEELEEMYGLLRWQGYDKDLVGFKKLMWYGIMKEFKCKAASTWSMCGRVKETAFMHKHLSPEKKEETSQLDWTTSSGQGEK